MLVRHLTKGCVLKPLRASVRHSSSVLWIRSNGERNADDVSYRKSWNRYYIGGSMFESIAESKVVEAAQNSLNFLHESTQLPWWAVIVVTTCTVRSGVTFPLSAYQCVIMARYVNLQVELRHLVGQLKAETRVAVERFKWDEKTAKAAYYRSFRKLRKGLIERDNCHPFKGSLVIWVQVPLWVVLSFALRNNMAGAQGIMSYLSMATEGTLWFTNLTLPDPYFLLPVLLGIVNLSIVEFHSLKSANPNKFQKGVSWVFRILSLAMVPVSALVPSGLALYWLTSSSVGLVHNVLLTAPSIRALLRIPRAPTDSPTPFKHMWEVLKKRFTR